MERHVLPCRYCVGTLTTSVITQRAFHVLQTRPEAPLFIAICGINGSGKTIQANLLQRHLEEQGRRCVIVKAYDEDTKAALQPLVSTWKNDRATMFLLLAAQSQQYTKTKELLDKGFTVIADRWDESYLAHHANFGFLSKQEDLRKVLSAIAFQGLLPDTGFVLHVPPKIAEERRTMRGEEDRFAGRSREYYEAVQRSYCETAAERGWHIIDGTQSPEAIHSTVIHLLALNGTKIPVE